jgi:hypothetical protein
VQILSQFTVRVVVLCKKRLETHVVELGLFAAAMPVTVLAGYVVFEQEVLHSCVSYTGRRGMRTGFLWGNLKEALRRPWHRWRIILK